MNEFSRKDEDRLLGYLKEAQALVVEDGLAPTDAIAKVAQDHNATLDMLPLMVHAYNVGRQGFQRQSHAGQGILAKTAEYPIANLEEVTRRVFPKAASPAAERAKTAVDASYRHPPAPLARHVKEAREKLAAACPPPASPAPANVPPHDPSIRMAKAYGGAERLAKQAEEARYQASAASDRLLRALGRLGDYFKLAAHDRLPLAEVEYNARRVFGERTEDCFDYIRVRNRTKEARAAGPPAVARPVSPDQEPYSLVKAALDAVDALVAARIAARAVAARHEKAAEALRPFVPAAPAQPAPRALGPFSPLAASREKAADLPSALLGGIVGAAQKGGFGEPRENLITDEELELNDPKHMQELQQIQSQAVFHDLMRNDEVISGFDPETVSEAYNELVSLNPSAATQPALLRPLLRKRLTAGGIEPFEASEMANTEKTLRQTESLAREGMPHAIYGSKSYKPGERKLA